MTDKVDDISIRESTQPVISGYRVGVSNIWERETPDATGTVAPRLTAQVTITDPGGEASSRHEVVAGTVLAFGADRYEVGTIEEGDSSPGAITLRLITD
jgi:hypothetical protein